MRWLNQSKLSRETVDDAYIKQGAFTVLDSGWVGKQCPAFWTGENLVSAW